MSITEFFGVQETCPLVFPMLKWWLCYKGMTTTYYYINCRPVPYSTLTQNKSQVQMTLKSSQSRSVLSIQFWACFRHLLKNKYIAPSHQLPDPTKMEMSFMTTKPTTNFICLHQQGFLTESKELILLQWIVY